MFITEQKLKDKVLGCWYGKNIGGTLGAPFEWRRQINNVTDYTQDLKGNPAPNDDLDIQLLWLIALEEQKLRLSTRELGYYFSIFVTPHWAEYGNAKANMKLGIHSPQCGLENNIYKESCGSYIRSEIWACIAAGTPDLAVKYMLADSAIDHGGNSEGTYAAVAVAAMEAAAFVESDAEKLIDIGMSYIPEESGIYKVTQLVRDCRKAGKTYLEARDEVLKEYRGAPFQYFDGAKTVALCSDRDRELGFCDGAKGYDAVDNFGIIIIGLLYGEGDFTNTLCYAVNCGEDTDCTAATLGSLLGIMHGYSSIPKRWIEPIGNAIKTICLNHGEIERMVPETVDELTERTMKLIKKSIALWGLNIEIGESSSGAAGTGAGLSVPVGKERAERLFKNADKAVFDFMFFEIAVSYPRGQYLSGGEGKAVISVRNKHRVSEHLEFRWYLPDGFKADREGGLLYLARDVYGNPEVEMEFTLSTDEAHESVNRFVFEASVVGRALTMTVPVLFLKG